MCTCSLFIDLLLVRLTGTFCCSFCVHSVSLIGSLVGLELSGKRMGGCLAAPSVEELDARKKAVNLEDALQKSQREDAGVIKMLLLGAGESGKSTLFKQAVALYGKGQSEKEILEYVPIIVENILISAHALITHAGTDISPKPISTKNLANKELILALDLNERVLKKQDGDALAALWSDEGIQAAYAQRSRFQLTDSTAYFFDRIHAVASPNYVPTRQDILRARARTTGIIETSFVVEGNTFKMFDVGGQRNERKKWIHCFESVTAVLFVAALSEYDQLLFEDDSTNRIVEALNLFDEVCNSPYFRQVSMILFLNKKDIFAEKIKTVPITVCPSFANYPGPREKTEESAFTDATEYIKDVFLAQNKYDEQKTVFVHVTCATDSENVSFVFTAVQDIVVRANLRNAGILM